METRERFEILAPLPSFGGFRRALAVDRDADARAVVLAYPPARIAQDPARFAALVRDARAAARVRHPNVASVLGLETVGATAALVEVHRSGATLRDLLDAGGRLQPEVAVRVIGDACAGIARAHAVDTGEGRALVHGAIAAEWLAVGDDGSTVVHGLGLGGGVEPAADVRALAAILYECLSGELPTSPPQSLEASGIPPALSAVIDRALGVAPGDAPDDAAALGADLEIALAPASREAVAAYAEAILPFDGGDRGALARLLGAALAPACADPIEVSDDLIVVDDGGDEPLDAQPAPGKVDLPCAATSVRMPDDEPVAESVPRTQSVATPVAAEGSSAAAPSAPRSAPSRSRAVVIAAILFAAGGIAVGFAAARGMLATPLARLAELASAPGAPASTTAPPTAVAAPAQPEAGPHATAAPTAPRSSPARRKGTKTDAGAASRAGPKGSMKVTAPQEAEVFLDGHRVGRGDVLTEVPVGAHRIEVRLGKARVAERFTIAAGETWTYDVTPTR